MIVSRSLGNLVTVFHPLNDLVDWMETDLRVSVSEGIPWETGKKGRIYGVHGNTSEQDNGETDKMIRRDFSDVLKLVL